MSSFVLCFVGGWDGDNYHSEILELVDGKWRQVATMMDARSIHAVSLINNEVFWMFCKS